MNKLNTLLFIALIFFGWRCNKNDIINEYKQIPADGWMAQNKINFYALITDKTKYYNVYLKLRHSNTYMYNNLYVFLTTKLPNGKSSLDTLEFDLAEPNGKWLGSGSGDLLELQVPLKKNMVFPLTGNYVFTFEQAMRINPLTEVIDFGLQIQQVQ